MSITPDDNGELRTVVVARGPWGDAHSAAHIITHSATHRLGLPPSAIGFAGASKEKRVIEYNRHISIKSGRLSERGKERKA
jgi:hypothetical protein